MFGWFETNASSSSDSPIFLHNTLGNAREEFKARGTTARMYNCGPTVYDKQQIGNLSAAVFADTIRRMLEYNGYEVKQVINITDFGHLVSDADEGEDKMTKGLAREGLKPTMENMKVLADRYTDQYMRDVESLGVDLKKIDFPRASAYIDSQIALIKTLDEKGYAYETKDGLYFDTKKFTDYGILGGIDLQQMKEGARVEVNPEKHSSADFALWKKDPALGWESPWGKGFPGWHIECSAMARSLLGEQIDIHTGGVEHISIHHNNEIAQTEVATGKKPFSRFWMHRAHIQIDGRKISKSLGNTIYLSDVVEHGFHPLALRYWFQTAHYRSHASFTWEALAGASVAFLNMHTIAQDGGNAEGVVSPKWKKKFQERINDDLDTAGAIAAMWEMVKDKTLSAATRRATLLDFDRVLGFGFANPDEALKKTLAEAKEGVAEGDISTDVRELLKKREEARTAKDWAQADKLRDEIKAKGFEVKDGESGPQLVRTTA